jgi:mono/diheme cytochrome c family protein
MMQTANRTLCLALIAVAALTTTAVRAADLKMSSTVERGKYLATAADCASCHTKPGGQPFAGGVTLRTPFGALVAPNITPDREAGIGSWTTDEFISALQDGRGRNGIRLYPAMPYPAYTKMTREDALAIRAYLQTIPPAPNKIEPNHLPFPFDIRATMIVWNAINFKRGQIAENPSKSPQWNRGHYLVDALGHCGTCHTPKTFMGADSNSAYLRGGQLQGWYAPNITADMRKGVGRWSINELISYLKTGASTYALASDDMGNVVVHSSSHLTDFDLKAIAVYLLSLSSSLQQNQQSLTASDIRMSAGQAIYKDNCAACHTDAGTGVDQLFPRLAGSPAVQSDDPTSLVRTILSGSQAAATPYAPTGPAMPSFAWRLNDAQTAAVVTYIRNSWGNAAVAVSADQVSAVKKTLGKP